MRRPINPARFQFGFRQNSGKFIFGSKGPDEEEVVQGMSDKNGRHERTRTADPYRVKVVLYQLSYVPKVKTRSRVDYFGERAKVANE